MRKFQLRKRGDSEPIMLCIMAKRHGGEKPWFLPYGERSEASPRKNFTAGERWRESARERSSRGEGVERERGIEPPYTAWKAVALPLCYSRLGVLGIEPRPHPPKGCVLPLYYTPFLFLFTIFFFFGQLYN